MSSYTLEHFDQLPDEITTEVSNGQQHYELSHGVSCDYQSFSIVARDDEDHPLGVLSAYTAYAEIYIDDLWVTKHQRRRGLGSALLRELEHRFKGKGYNNINLVTNAFQAVCFYLKCGYEIEFVRVNKHNAKLTKTFFIKYFDDDVQPRGLLNQPVSK